MLNMLPDGVENQASLYDGSVTMQLGNFGRKRHAYYWVEQDLFVPGCTSIIRRLDKPALVPWAAKQAAEYFGKELNNRVQKIDGKKHAVIPYKDIKPLTEAARSAHRTYTSGRADIGTAVHELAKRIFKGEVIGDLPANTDPAIFRGLAAIRSWIRDYDVTPLAAEQITFSKRWFFAGTFDLLATVNGILTMCDFKTSKAIYTEHRLQMSAYQIAWEEEYQEQIPQRCGIRLDTGSGQFEAHIFQRNEVEMQAFLRLKELDELMKKMEQMEFAA